MQHIIAAFKPIASKDPFAKQDEILALFVMKVVEALHASRKDAKVDTRVVLVIDT
jgi:hypothetical protein